MKFINHEAIYFYERAAEHEMNIIVAYLALIISAVIITVSVLTFLLISIINHQESVKEKILFLHSEINRKSAMNLKEYYKQFLQNLTSKKKKI